MNKTSACSKMCQDAGVDCHYFSHRDGSSRTNSTCWLLRSCRSQVECAGCFSSERECGKKAKEDKKEKAKKKAYRTSYPPRPPPPPLPAEEEGGMGLDGLLMYNMYDGPGRLKQGRNRAAAPPGRGAGIARQQSPRWGAPLSPSTKDVDKSPRIENPSKGRKRTPAAKEEEEEEEEYYEDDSPMYDRFNVEKGPTPPPAQSKGPADAMLEILKGATKGGKGRSHLEIARDELLRPGVDLRSGDVSLVRGEGGRPFIQVRVPLDLFCDKEATRDGGGGGNGEGERGGDAFRREEEEEEYSSSSEEEDTYEEDDYEVGPWRDRERHDGEKERSEVLPRSPYHNRPLGKDVGIIGCIVVRVC